MNSTFAMSQGAGQKLEFAFQRNDGNTADLEWLSTGENLKSVILFARGEAELVIKVRPSPKAELLDTIIRVDRSVRPSYPDWVERVEHSDLEPTGPIEYDISKVKQWFHDGQKNGKRIKGNEIHTYLKETDTLKTCLGLRDLEEIQKKGITFFRKHFQGKAVFAWKSGVRDRNRDGNLYVPFLYEHGGKVVMDWYWLGHDWDDSHPALRFAS